jgi:hypothetical protein
MHDYVKIGIRNWMIQGRLRLEPAYTCQVSVPRSHFSVVTVRQSTSEEGEMVDWRKGSARTDWGSRKSET